MAPHFNKMDLRFTKAGTHEKQLRRHFSRFDLPRDTVAVHDPLNILVFFNRSGSSMISEYLRATGRFSGFGEPLNHELVIERSTKFDISSFAGYLDWLRQNIHRPGTQFGIKASHEQVLMLFHSGAIPRYFANVRWIFVQRMDILSQAVSLSIAQQTRQWHSFEENNGADPVYDFKKIENHAFEISEAYAASQALISLYGITPYYLTYEQFLADPQQETRKLAAFLGETDTVINPGRLRLEKQANEINEDFKARFIADFRSRMAKGL